MKHGDGWYAHRPLDDSNEEWEVGQEIRVYCDHGGGVPLWDRSGRLPEEDEYLVGILGIDTELLADLIAWSQEWDRDPSKVGEEWKMAGVALAKRLQTDLGREFSVVLDL
jgi:hypothetical protein